MDPVTVAVTIDAPRERVFEYLADVANHQEFTDHFLLGWQLTREDSYGQGAGARFEQKRRFVRYRWADMTVAEIDPPRRILLRGRGGMFNRIRHVTVYSLERAPGGTTRVELRTETQPARPSDRIAEALGFRRWSKRNWKKALRRLRSIHEEGTGRGQRATIAGGGPRKPASAFRYRPTEHTRG